MNLSSDDFPFASVPPASVSRAPLEYVPLEYHDARVPLPEEQSAESAEANSTTEAGFSELAPEQAVEQPSADELFEARVEQERQAITTQLQQESERELQRVRAGMSAALEKFTQQRDEYFLNVESEVVQLALDVARRIIHRETQIDPRLLAGLVNYELEQLEQSTSVRLFVSPDTLNRWNEAVASLARPVELVADKALGAVEVRIETAIGSATVGFERELKEIERGFFDLLAHRPAAAEAKPVRVQ
jgi:flagellar assembly protein FliH